MLPEQPSPQPILPSSDETRKQKYWGMGLAMLGLAAQVFAGATLAPFAAFLLGMWLCVVGIAVYARARGISVAGGLFGLLPIVGLPLFWLLVPLFTNSRRVLIGFIVWLGVIGVLAAIAIPNFMHYGAKARQSEAKINLGGIYTTADAYKAENKTFAISDINQLGFMPSGTPLYRLWYVVNGVPTLIPGNYRVNSCDGPPTTIKVAASATGFTAAARGNMDGDPTCDEWSINDARTLTNTLNDVAH
jgi:type IV pilus assembly protein PilA